MVEEGGEESAVMQAKKDFLQEHQGINESELNWLVDIVKDETVKVLIAFGEYLTTKIVSASGEICLYEL